MIQCVTIPFNAEMNPETSVLTAVQSTAELIRNSRAILGQSVLPNLSFLGSVRAHQYPALLETAAHPPVLTYLLKSLRGALSIGDTLGRAAPQWEQDQKELSAAAARLSCGLVEQAQWVKRLEP